MKIIAQPESYSDMLERVFATTVASGLVCTAILANASPSVKALLDSIKTEAGIGPIKAVRALYVLLPILIAMISRIIRLHDKISDVLHIRMMFDTRYILLPMARLSGAEVDTHMRQRLLSLREPAMYKVFYPYVSLPTPAIDRQLIRTALDNWGWFWACVESAFLFIITGSIIRIIGRDIEFYLCVIVLLMIGLLLTTQWIACRRSADRQVRAIIDDPQRRTSIQEYFAAIQQKASDHCVQDCNMETVGGGNPS